MTDPTEAIRKALASDHPREEIDLEAIRALLDRLDSAERDAANVASYWITRGINPLKVERVQQIEGPDKWAIRQGGNCLNKSGEWEWEPMPSGRDDEFLARCRFDTAQEAIDAALRAGEQKEPK